MSGGGKAEPAAGRAWRCVGLVLVTAAVLVGCAEEVDRRPALPAPEPFPLAVEDVIPRLEVVGFSCSYSPDSDIPGGWGCGRVNPAAGDRIDVRIDSDETGPIQHVFAHFALQDEPVRVDAAAAEAFSELVIEPILPEDARPPLEAVHAIVADNFQMGVGDGFHLVFHRTIGSRTMFIQYSSQD